MVKKKKKAELRRCMQLKCGYLMNGGCKKCSDCKTDSFVINANCSRCLCCENIPNALRWDDGIDRDISKAMDIYTADVVFDQEEKLQEEPEEVLIIEKYD